MVSHRLVAAAEIVALNRKPAEVAKARLSRDINVARGIGRRVAIVRVADLEVLLTAAAVKP